MYRVELKVTHFIGFLVRNTVPNVPCGVESQFPSLFLPPLGPFLMYRVELKAQTSLNLCIKCLTRVPNVPCGVERWLRDRLKEIWDEYVPNVPCGVERL